MKRAVRDPGGPQPSDGCVDRETGSLPPAQSAVLVPLHVDAEAEWRVTLIRRADGEHRHAGQVAFPGGRHEPGRDESLLDTALRELEEEIGVGRSRVRVLGALSDRRTLSSNFTVTPYVGRLPFPCPFRPCAREVARIFSLPLRIFAPGQGRDHRLPCVRADGEVIWGVTLEILDELLQSSLVPRG